MRSFISPRANLDGSWVGDTQMAPESRSIAPQWQEFVRNEFYRRYPNNDGDRKGPIYFNRFRNRTLAEYPRYRAALEPALNTFITEYTYTYCDKFPQDERGQFRNPAAAYSHLRTMRPDLDNEGANNIWTGLCGRNATRAAAATESRKDVTARGSHSLPVCSGTDNQQTGDTNPPVMMKPIPSLNPPRANNLSHPTPSSNDIDSKALGPSDDILAKKLKQMQESNENERPDAQAGLSTSADREAPRFSLTGKLLNFEKGRTNRSGPSDIGEHSIRQAPLVAAGIIAEHHKDLLPQYGLLGRLKEDSDAYSSPQLFLNTNAPFSAFICGVQGSGKSHTTSCIIENAILVSEHLGRLESPVSTLVFSYGDWSSGGAGFNISEAAFFGAAHPRFPGHNVKKVTVLHSPSNPAIKRMYGRLPNVHMVPFRLKAKTLDIGALRTLMAVDERSVVPLYMATVEAILRDIATTSIDGCMDYIEFKRRLTRQDFDSKHINMFKMRINLLELFLDMNGTAPVPDFKPGEVTIIDLSDPFLTPSTACILFKLGLEQFLQSNAPGKMVVLDEAHKYMLNTPGSKFFTDHLMHVIRLQRHQGARVIVSTQEPTIATELIALCSVIVMHRFTSPAWYAALKRHINAVENDANVMQDVEALNTGEALVYSPNAVLGRNEDGSLIKPIGRLMKVNVRNRVTMDGGASIMAV